MQEIQLELLGGNFLEDCKQQKKAVDNRDGKMYTDEEERFTNGGAAMDSLAEQIISGARLGRRDDLGALLETDLEELCRAADQVRRALCGDRGELCTIVNGRSGRCSEDCRFCAQSCHYHTGAEEYPFLPVQEIVEEGEAERGRGGPPLLHRHRGPGPSRPGAGSRPGGLPPSGGGDRPCPVRLPRAPERRGVPGHARGRGDPVPR